MFGEQHGDFPVGSLLGQAGYEATYCGPVGRLDVFTIPTVVPVDPPRPPHGGCGKANWYVPPLPPLEEETGKPARRHPAHRAGFFLAWHRTRRATYPVLPAVFALL